MENKSIIVLIVASLFLHSCDFLKQDEQKDNQNEIEGVDCSIAGYLLSSSNDTTSIDGEYNGFFSTKEALDSILTVWGIQRLF